MPDPVWRDMTDANGECTCGPRDGECYLCAPVRATHLYDCPASYHRLCPQWAPLGLKREGDAAVVGDVTDPIRARLDQFHTCQGDEHAEMWRAALRAVLDLCDIEDETYGDPSWAFQHAVRRAIAENLGVDLGE